MQQFSVALDQRGPRYVAVIVSGEIDLATSRQMEEKLLPLVQADILVAVDLSGVTFTDSSGLHVFNRAARLAEERGAKFCLCAPSLEVRRVMDLVGAWSLFDVQDTLP